MNIIVHNKLNGNRTRTEVQTHGPIECQFVDIEITLNHNKERRLRVSALRGRKVLLSEPCLGVGEQHTKPKGKTGSDICYFSLLWVPLNTVARTSNSLLRSMQTTLKARNKFTQTTTALVKVMDWLRFQKEVGKNQTTPTGNASQ